MGNCIVAPPNEAHIISGPRGTRLAIGEFAFQLWCCEREDVLNLDMMTISLKSNLAETAKGVPLTVTSTAQVRVSALAKENAGTRYDRSAILLAAQHFLGSTPEELLSSLQRTLEGHQRQILGTLTVEEIYKDRAAFSSKVREHVHEDLENMGFEIVSYTVVEISDNQGYMQALGQTQSSLVRREAAEGTARNEAEAKKKVAQFTSEADLAAANSLRESHVGVNMQKEIEAESDSKLDLKRAEYTKLVNVKRAEAEAAAKIEAARQLQAVIREETQQKFVEAEVLLSVTDAQVERVQKEKAGEAKARLLAQSNDAEAIRVLAKAEADRIRLLGEAQADAVRAEGKAQADTLRARAEAFKLYNDAALVELVMNKMPEMAREVAAPLSKTEKMVFLSSDGASASRLTGEVVSVLGQLPTAVRALTGFDMNEAMKKLSDQEQKAGERGSLTVV